MTSVEVTMPVQTCGHFTSGTKYGDEGVTEFAGGRHGSLGAAFLDSEIAENLRILVPGKRLLDIGCGVGDWCCLAAQYGAKSVDGFDIQPKMVELAKQATSHLDMVHIQVGDAGDMPYDDDSFDVAISLFVTCNLSPEVYAKHFEELYRVLVPGGKVVLLTPSDWCHTKLYTKIEADPATVESGIEKIIASVPRYPSVSQIAEAFKDTKSIYITCFAIDCNGKLFHVNNVSQLTNGQPIWRQTEVMLFPNFFYSDKADVEHLQSTGFHIDRVENYCTDEKRLAYNEKSPSLPLGKEFVIYPPAWVYFVSKSC